MNESKLRLDEKGRIQTCVLSGTEIPFRKDGYGGFCPYLILNGKKQEILMRRVTESAFEGAFYALAFWLEYEIGEELTVRFRVKNRGETAFKPGTLGLCSGIDCYMEKYPDWNDRFFPTLLRCEKSHFWGYNQMPNGAVLAYASEEPADSWSIAYNELENSEDLCGYLTGGHRIYTWNVHLLNRGPGPERHPRMEELAGGQEKTLTLHFRTAGNIEQVMPLTAHMAGAPGLRFACHTLEAGGVFYGRAWNVQKVWQKAPDGTITKLGIGPDGELAVENTQEIGLYEIRAVSAGGKEAQALLYIRRPASWYLYQGREAVLENRPLHTHHVEAFNSLYTIILARKYLGDQEKDACLEQDFLRITGRLYDSEKQMAAENPWRIQDSAALSALFAYRYELTQDPEDLKKAGALADYLLSCQGEDGAYYSIRPDGEKTHYTSVTYIARYLMDTAAAEERAAQRDPGFGAGAARHQASAERAVEELVRNRDNIDTEGELTFEDGMISCSILQIAYMALQMEEGEKKREYVQAAEEMYKRHECLTQKVIPDCRMNGATLRFWEAQYNLHVFHNMMNSPCGWTCWKIYGVWYLYLLTGKREYLLDMMNALGACLQLIDKDSKKLRWGFVCDPYVETLRYVPRTDGKSGGMLKDDIIGEQYLDMVSPWHREEIFPRKKWGIDNLVHEVFKCLAEVGLLYAYVYEEEDGSLLAWNARACREGGRLQIFVTDRLVKAIHCRLQKETQVEVPEYKAAAMIQSGWLSLTEKAQGTVNT